MKNRIKELRKNNNLTLKQLGSMVGLATNTISQYETGDRNPKLETWIKMSEIFDVPVSYLQGISDDITGLQDWVDVTGYSKNELKKEIARMQKYNRIKIDDDSQKQIIQAVKNLEQHGNDELSALSELQAGIKVYARKLLDEFFIDQEKLKKQGAVTNGIKIISTRPPFYDDMRPEVYQEAIDIISSAQRELSELKRRIIRGEFPTDTSNDDHDTKD